MTTTKRVYEKSVGIQMYIGDVLRDFQLPPPGHTTVEAEVEKKDGAVILTLRIVVKRGP